MYFFDCEKGFVPDNGQNDVTDGSVENFDFDWGPPVPDERDEAPQTDDNEVTPE